MKRITCLTLAVLLALGATALAANYSETKADAPTAGVRPAEQQSTAPHTPGLYQGGKANLAEGFESTTFPPTGWRTVNVLGANVWGRSTVQFHSGAASARIGYQSTGGEDWLITPPMYPQSLADSLTFWARTVYAASYPPDSLLIKVSTTDSNVASFTTTIMAIDVNALVWNTWNYLAAPLGAFDGQRIFVAFQHKDYDGNGVYVDDVTGAELVQPNYAHDLKTQSIDAPTTAIVAPGVAFYPAYTLKNAGTNPETGFNIRYLIYDSTGTEVYNQYGYHGTPDTLAPDSTLSSYFGLQFTPDALMRYQAVVASVLAGDERPSNDTMRFNFRTYDLDAGTAAITVPAAGMIGFDTTIAPQATYHNYATEPATFDAFFQIDYLGSPIYQENVTIADLAPGADTTITFPEWAGPHDLGAHEFYAYTVMDWDLNPANDMVQRTVTLSDWVVERMAPLPAARLSHTLAYDSDNDKIYLFGGGDGSSYNDNNWQYDPVANSWAVMTALPAERRWSSSVYDNGKIYVLGGLATGDIVVGTTLIYDVAGDSWTPGTAMPTVGGMVGAVAHNGYIYRLGGYGTGGTYVPDVQYYDPAGDTWTAATSIPSNWGWGQAALVGDRIWLVGGYNGSATYANLVYGDIDGTDPATITWATGSALAGGDRANNGADAFGDGLVMSGGYLSGFTVTTNTVYHYDIGTDVWTALPSLPVPDTRMDNLITRTGHNQFFVIGGDTASAWVPSSTVYSYRKVVSGVAGKPVAVTRPGTLTLYGNYPNPVRGNTTISFQLPKAGRATLAVYSVTGQLVKTLASGNLPAGRHSVSWNGQDNGGRKVSSGVYFYRLSAVGGSATGKLVVVR